MKSVFADTCYWIAITNPKDQLHERALTANKALGRFRVVTSEMVLVEFLNSFSGKGGTLREHAVKAVEAIMGNPNVDVVPQTSRLFRESLAKYRKFQDKEWGLTDCACMNIMEERGIVDVLTNDHHFQQAGFNLLM